MPNLPWLPHYRDDKMGVDKPSALDARHVSLLWASPDRAGDVAALHAQLFDPPWDHAAILKLLEHPAAAALMVTARSQVNCTCLKLPAVTGTVCCAGVTEWKST